MSVHFPRHCKCRSFTRLTPRIWLASFFNISVILGALFWREVDYLFSSHFHFPLFCGVAEWWWSQQSEGEVSCESEQMRKVSRWSQRTISLTHTEVRPNFLSQPLQSFLCYWKLESIFSFRFLGSSAPNFNVDFFLIYRIYSRISRGFLDNF